MPGIIDLSKFIYEDLEEIVAGGQGSFEVYCRTQVVTNKQTNKQTNIHTYIHIYPLCLCHCFSQPKFRKILSLLTNQHSVVLPSMLLTFETRPSSLRNLQMAYSKAKLTVFRI